jgi:hypothetical protein
MKHHSNLFESLYFLNHQFEKDLATFFLAQQIGEKYVSINSIQKSN